jgi:nucleotide-binding universal stress UspA family protein
MPTLPINNILYATDFSESSVPACDYALTLCKLTGAQLHVLHVIGELSDDRRGLMMLQSLPQLEQELQTQSVQEMEDFCVEYFDAEICYETETVIGSPFQEILSASTRLGVDMIVMGTHGRTGIEHALVGSTAERVVRRSEVPVLTVRSRR